MFLAEPPRTAYDLHFRLLGIPVRITPFFWVASVLLGYSLCQSFSSQSQGELSVGLALILWTLAVLVSILVHEFGHALAFRAFGVGSDVVLYHFGGLAIPSRTLEYTSGREPWQDPKKQIVISAAGPLAQFLLAIAVGVVFYGAGYYVPKPIPWKFFPWFPPRIDYARVSYHYPPMALWAFEVSLIFSSVWWALLNLLPIYPLDGGQIAREIFNLANPREGVRYSLMLSIVVGGLVATWGFMHDDNFMGIMFAMLAYSSFVTLQAYFGGGRLWGRSLMGT